MLNLNDFTTIDFDMNFKKLQFLKWYPWIGKKYKSCSTKILIVGESHYLNKEQLERLEVINNDIDHTRHCVYEAAVQNATENGWKRNNSTYSNLNKIFQRYSYPSKQDFWSSVAYYNFIQRVMNYAIKERPTGQDFYNAWFGFVNILEIIKPDVCLFIGVAASNTFHHVMNNMNRDFNLTRNSEKINRTYPRKASIIVNGSRINLHFIKHCSSYFSPDKWGNYLLENEENLEFLFNRNE
ncbi:MAG: hypothetical protein PQJ44_06575 [Sphaerochaetaceae bacterium]|nr:hypothetical protein [Sphaerochaetaceae bacterium]